MKTRTSDALFCTIIISYFQYQLCNHAFGVSDKNEVQKLCKVLCEREARGKLGIRN